MLPENIFKKYVFKTLMKQNHPTTMPKKYRYLWCPINGHVVDFEVKITTLRCPKILEENICLRR